MTTQPTKKELEIVFKLKNDVSKEMAKVTAEVKKGGDEAEKSGKKGTKEFNAWEAATKRVGAAIKGLLNPLTLIGGALGVGAIVGLAKGMSTAADEAESVQGKFDLVFGSRADDYAKRIDAIATEIGRSRTELRGMAADTQTVVEELIGSAEAADAVTEAMVRLAIDVGELTNRADAEVLEKFTQAIQGSGRALQGMAASIKPAEVDAKALALGLAATTEELTEQDRVLARIEILFQRFEKAQGEAGRSSDEFGSRMKELTGLARDAREQFGQRLNDAIVQGFDDAGGIAKINDLVTVFNGAIAEFAKQGVTLAAQVAGAAADALDRFGGADGVIRWLQERGAVLTAEIRLFGAELSVVAVEFAGGIERMLERLRPALEFLGLVQSRAGGGFAQTQAERDELQRRFDNASAQHQAAPWGRAVLNDIAELDRELERMARLAEFDAARVASREQLAAAQARLTANESASDPWATADFSGLGPAIARATGGGSTNSTTASVNEARTALVGLSAAQQDAHVAAMQHAQSLQTVGIAAEDLAEQVSAADRFAQRQTAQLADAWLGVATGAIKAKDAVKQFFQQFIADMLRVPTQQGFNALFGSLFSSIFAGINPGAAPVAGDANFVGPVLNANGNVLKGGLGSMVPVNGYANGGPIVRSPHMALIGEGRYNEAVVPLPDGRTIPVRMQGGSGGTVNVALTIQAVDARSVTNLLADDEQGFGALLTKAITSNRDVNAIVRGRST